MSADAEAWSSDFIRAIRERSLLMRKLFKLSLGKYAKRELIGLIEDIEKSYNTHFDYNLENANYHKDKHKKLDI